MPPEVAYFAFIGPVDARAGFGGARGPVVYLESESFTCRSELGGRHDANEPNITAVDQAAELALLRERWRGEARAGGCPELARRTLMANESSPRALVMIDAEGRDTVVRADAAQALLPIDSPAKAAAWLWLQGRELETPTEKGSTGGLDAAYVTEAGDAFEVLSTLDHVEDRRLEGCDEVGTSMTYRLTLRVSRDGQITESGRVLVRQGEHFHADACRPLGRRPEGFVEVPSRGTLRDWLASAMHHEAESVRAFERLARELEAHGAGAELVEAARCAAEDERDHAWRVAELASQLGFHLHPRIAPDRLPVRSLAEAAHENAVEGCVLEAYGAALAAVQAQLACDPRVRAHAERIAEDELRHAALAFTLRDFFRARLSAAELAAVDAAEAEAGHALRASLRDPSPLERALGFPDRAVATRLADAVVAQG